MLRNRMRRKPQRKMIRYEENGFGVQVKKKKFNEKVLDFFSDLRYKENREFRK
jgi:hypothetical protein